MVANTPLKTLGAPRGAATEAMGALDRAARAPRLLDAPLPDSGAAMRALRVVVIGLGSVGSYFSDQLARSTVGELVLVDPDRIAPESVLTHPVQPRDIGRPKARLAGTRAKAVSPATRVRVFDGPVQELSVEVLVDASAVLLASDNLAAELEVTKRCQQLGLPLIQASVHGPTLVAQVRSLGNPPGGHGACLACGYQQADWDALDRGTRFSCAGGEVEPHGAPTVSPPQLCCLAASLALTELLGRSTGLVSPDQSRLIEYCGFEHRTTVTPLARRDACTLEHRTWRVATWIGALRSATPRELLAAAFGRAAARVGASDDVSLCVPGYRFTRLGLCECDAHPAVERFQPLDVSSATCSACGTPLAAHPFHTHEQVPRRALEAQLDRTLGALGAGAPRAVLVRRAGETALFRAPRRGTA